MTCRAEDASLRTEGFYRGSDEDLLPSFFSLVKCPNLILMSTWPLSLGALEGQ